jgi:hypothetical protein
MTVSEVSAQADRDHFGDPGPCDLCGRPLHDERLYCDAQLPAHGNQWATLCHVCAVTEGIRPGWGQAQFYEQVPQSGADQATGIRWRCVAGGPPNALTTD